MERTNRDVGAESDHLDKEFDIDAQSVDLNHATVEQLSTIDTLDRELASAIVMHRVHHGHFTSWDQVATVAGIGTPQLDALKESVRLHEGARPGDAKVHGGQPISRGSLP